MRTAFLLLFSLALHPLFADPSPSVPEKTARYHQLLLKRPDSATLFERFLNAWLDTHSKEELETFLKAEAQAQNHSPNHALLLTVYHQWIGQETKALSTLDTALYQNPTSSPLLLARAKLKAQLLDFDSALGDLDKAGPLTDPDDLLLRGTWLARSGQPDEAVAVWKKLLTAQPQNENLTEDLIELEVTEGLYQEALETLNQLITETRDPYQKALRTLRLANIQELAGQSQEALLTYQNLLPQSGQNSWLEKEILAQIEQSFRRQDNLTGLRDFYQTLRQDLPQRISLRKGLAAQMALNDEEEEAIALFQEILKLTPGDRANRLQFITLLEDLENFDLALTEIAFLLRKQPNDQNLLEHQARLHHQTHNQEKLKASLATLTELRAEDPTALLATANLYQHYEFLTESEDLLRSTALKFPHLLESREALASFLAEPSRNESKQAEATQIWLELAKDSDAEGLLRVARALQSNNRSQECFQLLQKRIPEFPDHPLLLTQLCNVALKSSRAEEAFPHALHLTNLAQVPTEFEASLRLVAQLARQLEVPDLIADLDAHGGKSSIQWCVLAELHQILGDFDSSTKALAHARQIDDSVFVANQEIRLLNSRGNWPQAIARLRELIASPGGNRPANLNKLIQLLIDSGDIPAALVEVENWKKRSPGDKHAWLQRADLLTRNGRLREAALELRRAHTKFNHDSDIRQRLAKALLSAGDYSEAERLYFKIYQEADDTAARNQAITELATLAKQEGRSEKLLTDFQRRKRQNPNETSPLLALARIHEILEQYDEQHSALAEALRRRPKDSTLRLQLSKQEENAGLLDQAANTLQDGLDLTPGPKIRQALSDFYFRTGELERGLALSATLNQDDPRAIESTVLSLCQKQEWELAIRQLDLASSPDSRLQSLRAFLLVQQNQDQQAIPLIAQLLSETPSFPPGLSVTSSPQFNHSDWNAWLTQSFPKPEKRLFYHFSNQFQIFQQSVQQSHSYGISNQLSSLKTSLLPGNADELRSFLIALVHQKSLTITDPEKKALFLAHFPIPQDPHHQSLFNPNFSDWILDEFENQRVTLPQLLEFGGRVLVPRETLIAAVKDPRFFAEHPTTALAISLDLAGDQADGEENQPDWLTPAIQFIPQLKEAQKDQYLQQLCAMLLGGRASYYYTHSIRSHSTIFTPDHLKLFRKIVFQEISTPRSDQSPCSQKPWFQYFRKYLHINNQGADYLQLLNLSCQEFLTQSPQKNPHLNQRLRSHSPYSTHNLIQRSSFGSYDSPSTPPSFPPNSSPLPFFVYQDFPNKQLQQPGNTKLNEAQQRLLDQWHQLTEIEPTASPSSAQQGLNPETFLPFISQIENKRVRALAYHWAEAEEELESLISEFATSDDPQLLLFALAYNYDPKEGSQNLSLLKRIPREQLPKTQRTEVDRYWVQIGAYLNSRKKLSPNDLALVKKAALRYRSSSEATRDSRTLNNFLTRIDPALTTAPTRTTRSTQYNPRAPRYTASPKTSVKIKALLATKQTEKATSLALNHLLSSFRRHRNLNDRNIREVLELLKEHSSLKEALLATVESRNQESYQARLFAAELQSALDNPNKALAISRKLTLTRLEDKQLTAKIESLEQKVAYEDFMADPSQEITLEELTTIMKYAGYSQQSSGNNYALKKPLPTYLAAATRVLNTTEPSDLFDKDLNWPLYLLLGSARKTYFGNLKETSPSLTTSGHNFDPERIRLISEFLTACLRHPQLAERAFQIATGCQSALNYTPEQLHSLALETLKVSSRLRTAEQQKANQPHAAPSPRFDPFWNYNNGAPEFGLNPQSYLSTWIIQHRLLEDSPEFQALTTAFPELTEQTRWAIQLTSSDLTEAQIAFVAWLEILDKDPNSKLKRIALQLQDLANMPEPPPILESFQQKYCELAFAHWKQRNFSHSGLLTPSFNALLAKLWNPEDPQTIRSILDQILSQSLGDQSLWPDFVALAEKNQLPPPLRVLSSSYSQISDTLLTQSQDIRILPILLSYPPFAVSLRSSNFREILKKQYPYKTAEESWQVFQEIDLDNFAWETLAFSNTGESSYFLNYLYSHFASSSESKKLLLEKITAQPSPSLKTLLFSYNLSRSNETRNNLLLHLEENASHILALPIDTQEAVVTLLQTPFPLGVIPPTTTFPKASSLLQTLNQERKDQLYTRLQEILTEGFTEEYLVKHNHRIPSEITKLIQLSLFEKPQLASQLTIDYFTALSETLKFTYPDRAHEKFAESYRSALHSIITKHRSFLDYIPYLAALEASPLSAELPLLYNYSPFNGSCSRLIDSLPQREELSEVEKSLFPRWHWDDLAEQLQPLDPHHRQLATYYLLIHDQIRPHANVSDLWQWTLDSGFRERHPQLCQSLLLSTSFFHWTKCSPEQKNSLFQTWQDHLTDPALSLRLRMSLAIRAIERGKEFSQEKTTLNTTIPLARQWLSQHRSMPDKKFLALLQSYQALADVEQTEDLNHLLRECLEKITSNLFLALPQNAHFRYEYFQALGLLALHLQDRESFQTVSQHLGPALAGKPNVLFLLAKMDDRESINHLLAREDSYYSSFQQKWNTSTAKEVAHLLSLIDDPQKRFRLECHLSSHADDTQADDQTFQKRSTRLLQLAEQFQELGPKVPTARLECLRKLCSPFDLERAQILEPPLTEVYQRWPYNRTFEDIRGLSSSSIRTILDTYLQLRIAQNDFTPAIASSKSILTRIEINDRSSSSEKDALSRFIHFLIPQIIAEENNGQKNPLDPELHLLTQQLLPLLCKKERINTNFAASILHLAILTHQSEGTTQELFTQLTELPEDTAANFSRASRSLTGVGTQHNFRSFSPASKALYFQSLTQDLVVSQHLFNSYKLFTQLIQFLHFDKEHLVEWSLQLPENYPRRGEVILASATAILQNRKELETAYPLFDAALAQAKNDNDDELQALTKIQLASTLRYSDKEKAAALIHSLTFSDLPESEQRRAKGLFKWAETIEPTEPQPAEPETKPANANAD